MPDHPSWRLLPAAAHGIPSLLVSTVFTAESYNIHLTDLANVWVECMDRKPIVKRGLVEDTSIDPTDGPDQIRKMLELLRAAFDVSDPDHASTSLSLSLAKDGDDSSLVIHITCILPKPLKPFRWPMHLKKCPQSTLATELMLPLVEVHLTRMRQIEDLVSVLREKDSIITRLIDKLEATGTGLEHVFNSLSGKRKVTRAAAEGKIKGLAPFVEADLRNGPAIQSALAGLSDVTTLLKSVFGAAGLEYRQDMELEASPMLDDWWTKLGKGQQLVLAERSKEEDRETPPSLQPTKTNDNREGDDFQVQATPPGLAARKRPANTRPEPLAGDETSDGDETSEGDGTVEIPKSLPSHNDRMAGKKAPSAEPVTHMDGTSDDDRGRKKSAAAPRNKPETLRETSQERADRKRAELQKDLEKRAAAGPAKKKRKF
ncbi:XRCC4-like factor-domain-containing protein [Lasiosphaeria miniovina]|uniref:Non-homologous end-joining factor 1 n=1 Tax=Lasiosphaeria miniovina TaxID=1954250 RepID=A0AA40ECQ2_9PEZI|nr:XRCC4-like factor-domain-containing protein [Lasiosphaeria miniovina]KAK0735185.1 XRCC4-like factor-domain-containing protein [Lasiosphaeria miniovina]